MGNKYRKEKKALNATLTWTFKILPKRKVITTAIKTAKTKQNQLPLKN